MIDELKELLDIFPGAENRTRCFTHILNLVAKSILHQFDTPKAKADKALDAAARALADLAADLDDEEEEMERNNVADGDEEDDEEGLIDIRESMSPEEIEELDASVQPVRVVLVKVSSISDSKPQTLSGHDIQLQKLAYAVKNSTTIILPEWFSILERLAEAYEEAGKDPLSARMMPRDVSTRWNATFDMLNFAVEYREVIDEITGNMKMKLRQFELTDEEWVIAKQLSEVLKVS